MALSNIHGELLQKFLGILEMTEYAKVLWLENEILTDKTEYLYMTLDTDHKEMQISWEADAVQEMLTTIVQQGQMQDVEMEGYVETDLKENTEEIRIRILLTHDLHYAPFYLILHKKEERELFPEMREYQLVEGEIVHLLQYPMDEIAMKHVVEILKNLELIGTMEHYERLYYALQREAFSGRKMQILLKKMLQKQGVDLDANRWMLWKSYGTYTYMRKRWKTYAKKRTTVDWWEIFESIANFLTPIVEANERQEIFLGDWMPKLGRYLD